MNARKRQIPKNRVGKMGRAVVVTVFCFLFVLPGACFSPQPLAKQANDLAALRQAGLMKDRSQVPALLAALKNPNDPFEHSATISALHALAQIGATEALPAINTLTSASHDASLVNFAAAAKARVLAESGAQAIKDPQARVRAKLAALYHQAGLTPDALNLAAKEYQARVSTPGEPVPLGVCVMREAADVLYQEGVASSGVEAAPPDYSLDPASALKVRLAGLSPQPSCTMIDDFTNRA